MRKTRRTIWAIIAVCLLPLVAVLLSTTLAALLGCELSEAGPQACIVLGLDLGGLLSSFFVMGWIALFTLPLIGVVVLLWAVMEVLWLWRRQRRSRNNATGSAET